MKPLQGGIKLDGKKEATLLPWSAARPTPPRRVRIPLAESPGFSFRPLVRIGDRVRVGEPISEAKGRGRVHASISGTISEIALFPYLKGDGGEAIEILSDGKDEKISGIGTERRNWEGLTPSELIQILEESGVADSNLHAAFTARHSIHTVILNGCQPEPYLTSDHSLMLSHPVEVLRAGEIFQRSLGAKNLILALEDRQEEVAEVLKSKVFFHTWSQAKVEMLPARYPIGENRILIHELLGLPLFSSKSPVASGVLVLPISSAFAFYEAVVLQKPFYERIVTIAGECVAQPRNFWIRIGTLVEDAVKYARGFLREPERVILGGPMSGVAVGSLSVPVLKETSAILGLPKEVAARPESLAPCIRCGQCLEVCPSSISPAMITLAAERDLFDLAQEVGSSECIECGNCSYICPAKRPMLELIQYANAH